MEKCIPDPFIKTMYWQLYSFNLRKSLNLHWLLFFQMIITTSSQNANHILLSTWSINTLDSHSFSFMHYHQGTTTCCTSHSNNCMASSNDDGNVRLWAWRRSLHTASNSMSHPCTDGGVVNSSLIALISSLGTASLKSCVAVRKIIWKLF